MTIICIVTNVHFIEVINWIIREKLNKTKQWIQLRCIYEINITSLRIHRYKNNTLQIRYIATNHFADHYRFSCYPFAMLCIEKRR